MATSKIPNSFLNTLSKYWDDWGNKKAGLYAIPGVPTNSANSTFERYWRASFWGKGKFKHRSVFLILPELEKFTINFNNINTKYLKVKAGKNFKGSFKEGSTVNYLEIFQVIPGDVIIRLFI